MLRHRNHRHAPDASSMTYGREESGRESLENVPICSEKGRGCGGQMGEVEELIPKHQVPGQ